MTYTKPLRAVGVGVLMTHIRRQYLPLVLKMCVATSWNGHVNDDKVKVTDCYTTDAAERVIGRKKIVRWWRSPLSSTRGRTPPLFSFRGEGKSNSICLKNLLFERYIFSFWYIGNLNQWSTWLPPYFGLISSISTHYRYPPRVALIRTF